MTLENLEAEVFALPRDSQVTILARLLEGLGQSDEIDREAADLWIEQAETRDRAMDSDRDTEIPAKQVFQRIRSSLSRVIRSVVAENRSPCSQITYRILS